MKKRNLIYAGLLAFVAAGVLIDWYFWRGVIPNFTLNDLVQLIGIILLTSWWQITDANLGGHSRGSAARFMTVMFMPVGVGIYLYQTRSAWPATIGLVGFLGGITLCLVAADYLGYTLFAG